MPVDPHEVFPEKAVSESVARSLASRISGHSVELILQLELYLQQNNEGIDDRKTFDGTDASAKLCFALLEAILAYEQLRLELVAQPPEKLPVRLLSVMSRGSRLEPALLHIAKEAFEMHTALWDAGSVSARKKKEPFY